MGPYLEANTIMMMSCYCGMGPDQPDYSPLKKKKTVCAFHRKQRQKGQQV